MVAAVPRDRWPDHGRDFITQHWADPWGDRRQEIVFIGAGMERAAITAALDSALVAGERFLPSDWTGLSDPFPLWQRKAA